MYVKKSINSFFLPLVQLFIAKGASEWGRAIVVAAKHGHKHLFQTFLDKGASKRHLVCGAAQGGHKDIIMSYFCPDLFEWANVVMYVCFCKRVVHS
jgi:hypothetical protein